MSKPGLLLLCAASHARVRRQHVGGLAQSDQQHQSPDYCGAGVHVRLHGLVHRSRRLEGRHHHRPPWRRHCKASAGHGIDQHPLGLGGSRHHRAVLDASRRLPAVHANRLGIRRGLGARALGGPEQAQARTARATRTTGDPARPGVLGRQRCGTDCTPRFFMDRFERRPTLCRNARHASRHSTVLTNERCWSNSVAVSPNRTRLAPPRLAPAPPHARPQATSTGTRTRDLPRALRS